MPLSRSDQIPDAITNVDNTDCNGNKALIATGVGIGIITAGVLVWQQYGSEIKEWGSKKIAALKEKREARKTARDLEKESSNDRGE